MSQTKEEIKLQRAGYRAKHKEEIAAYDATYQAEHRERDRARKNAATARSYVKHRPERLETNAQRYVENREEILAYHANRYQENTEEICKKTAEWRHANPEKKKAINAAWEAANPEKRLEYNKQKRARKANAPVNDLTHAQWMEIQSAQDHCCAHCKKRCKGKLSQDHVTPLSKGGSHTLHNVIGVCRSCNSKKGTRPSPVLIQPMLLTIAPSKKKKAA